MAELEPNSAVSPPLPPRPRIGPLLFGVPRVGSRWGAGARSALAFGLPALIGQLLGLEGALFASLGAFAVMYGENRPYASRWRVVLAVGAVLFVTAGLGLSLGHAFAGQSAWPIEMAVLVVVAAVLVFIGSAIDLPPPGSFFWFLVCEIAFQIGKAGKSPGPVLAWLVVGVVASLIITMSGAILDRTQPERDAVAAADRAVAEYERLRAQGEFAALARQSASEAIYDAWAAIYDARLHGRPEDDLVQALSLINRRFRNAHNGIEPGEFEPGQMRVTVPLARPSIRYRLARSFSPSSHQTATTARLFLAGALAAAVCIALHLDRPDWALIAATLVFWQGPTPIPGTVRAAHRFLGTVLGLGVFAGLVTLSPGPIALILSIALLMFLIDLFVASNYGIAVIFITPVALLIGTGGHVGSIGTMVVDRGVENLIGASIAVAVLWTVLRHAHRRRMLWTQRRITTAARNLLHALNTHPTTAPTALRLRGRRL